ncbi:FAD-dependent monooxygenase [Lichenifustis flavocetrariae]|uniref:FAD-dependent monooxygenase n=1 Tax=Lichenifustis flavocetrariae TaxID=2949735 RepID=A0AA41YVU8_9HYPH|nr:FAD-dependent monooxygenase [Lichenifustis flavocetrariae]MCW6509516.1 FAD-dependent monooxygenase [Lichenifustis flavocetrariae]
MAAPPFSDIIVAGAGIAGASFALSIKRAVGALVTVTLCDPALAKIDGLEAPRHSMRAVAVAPDAQQSLETLGVWHEIAASTQPIRSMTITDSRPGALPNPIFLRFDGQERAEGYLAHMAFTGDLRGALLRACQAAGVLFVPVRLTGFKAESFGVRVEASEGASFRGRLLVAADGGRSRLRSAGGVQVFGGPYPQSGIVATLHHARSHEGRAVQHFLPAGPLALLPLRAQDGSPHRSSIVWTETSQEAARLVGLPAEGFLAALQDRIGFEYGQLTLEDQPAAVPLRFALARRLVGPRLALLGDAARVVHPLAGQGLNLGLRDAMALSSQVAEVVELGLDPGADAVLKAYQRDRQFDATAMVATTDLMNRLFSNDHLPVRLLRDIGLGLVDRTPRIKRMLIGGATGLPRAS